MPSASHANDGPRAPAVGRRRGGLGPPGLRRGVLPAARRPGVRPGADPLPPRRRGSGRRGRRRRPFRRGGPASARSPRAQQHLRRRRRPARRHAPGPDPAGRQPRLVPDPGVRRRRLPGGLRVRRPRRGDRGAAARRAWRRLRCRHDPGGTGRIGDRRLRRRRPGRPHLVPRPCAGRREPRLRPDAAHRRLPSLRGDPPPGGRGGRAARRRWRRRGRPDSRTPARTRPRGWRAGRRRPSGPRCRPPARSGRSTTTSSGPR